MRKLLLASAAMLASGSAAFAQMESSGTFQSQGQMAMPWNGSALGAQNNLNTWGTSRKGGAMTPQPGTVVIRLNGRVYVQGDASYGNLLQNAPGAIYGSLTAPNSINPVTGASTSNKSTTGYKLNPIGFSSFLRLYPGIDGMATNGLRYGAAVEIRENFEGGNNFAISNANSSSSGGANTVILPSGTAVGGTAANASGVSSGQTLFVRRAFAYLGSDMAGILRVGQQDGLVGIYDATGMFTTGGYDGGIGNINNGGLQAVVPSNYLLSWPFLSGNGTEYGNNKIVYLTPSFFGFDFGIEYAANQGNSFSSSVTSSPYQAGTCSSASNNCINVTSGNDSSRWINRVSLGGRYAGSFNGLALNAYGAWIHSGKESIPGGGLIANGSNTLGTATNFGGSGSGALAYDPQNFFNGGVAATYAGLTINSDFTFGRTNGSNAMVTQGGTGMSAVLVGATYAYGPFAVGFTGAMIDSQGAVQLTKVSQRHEFAIAVGGSYKLAPGITLAAEYQYEQKHQGGFNFASGAVGSAAVGGNQNNDIRVQGFTLATVVSW